MSTFDDYSSRVLDVVDAIPPGQVMSYGDVAEYLGAGGPRQVGRVLARYGGGTAWWRVIHADGTPPPGHDAPALEHYLAEGTPLRSGVPGWPVRVDMRRARWAGDRLPFECQWAVVKSSPDERIPTRPRRLTGEPARAGP